jgi:regulatory protein
VTAAERVAALGDPGARLQHALDLAFRSLNRRELTVLEVRRLLEAKRVEPATVDAAVDELHRQRYLDDARFATRFAEDKRRLEGWGADRIERRLLTRGVDCELARDALAGCDRASELDAALALLRRRFPSPLTDSRAWRSAYGVLVRKGYDPELAADALRSYGDDALAHGAGLAHGDGSLA